MNSNKYEMKNHNIAGNFVMGGLLLGTFELPLSTQIDDQLPLYDSTEGEVFPFPDTSSRRQNGLQVWKFR